MSRTFLGFFHIVRIRGKLGQEEVNWEAHGP